jgi:hypothetical protein
VKSNNDSNQSFPTNSYCSDFRISRYRWRSFSFQSLKCFDRLLTVSFARVPTCDDVQRTPQASLFKSLLDQRRAVWNIFQRNHADLRLWICFSSFLSVMITTFSCACLNSCSNDRNESFSLSWTIYQFVPFGSSIAIGASSATMMLAKPFW